MTSKRSPFLSSQVFRALEKDDEDGGGGGMVNGQHILKHPEGSDRLPKTAIVL